MRRLIPPWATLALVLLLAMIVAAQGSTRVNGQVVDLQGKPWAGVTIVIKNPENGQTFTLKTDKDGKYTQLLSRGGVYAITIEPEKLNYSEKHTIQDGQENTIVINFKDIMAQQVPSPEEAKKAEEAANSFKNMKGHFDAGVAAMTDTAQLRQQLSASPADQKGTIQDKIKADSQTAVTEFQQAEQAAGTKDVKNHALIWANLGQAYDSGGRYDEAADAYQKAIDLQPMAPYYTHLSTSLANAAVSQTDPKVTQQKVADAGTSCEKTGTLEGATPGSAAVCWKNLGIILNNKGDLKDAILPFQKATQADPKDAQSWFLLGGALTGSIDTKQEGDKVIYIVPQGTTDAYQKCIEVDPNGPYAAQAKAALDSLAQLSGGAQTTVSERKKKSK
jgi:tetratricopeptide (TPR) repeat protein